MHIWQTSYIPNQHIWSDDPILPQVPCGIDRRFYTMHPNPHFRRWKRSEKPVRVPVVQRWSCGNWLQPQWLPDWSGPYSWKLQVGHHETRAADFSVFSWVKREALPKRHLEKNERFKFQYIDICNIINATHATQRYVVNIWQKSRDQNTSWAIWLLTNCLLF